MITRVLCANNDVRYHVYPENCVTTNPHYLWDDGSCMIVPSWVTGSMWEGYNSAAAFYTNDHIWIMDRWKEQDEVWCYQIKIGDKNFYV